MIVRKVRDERPIVEGSEFVRIRTDERFRVSKVRSQETIKVHRKTMWEAVVEMELSE
jgi:hypothetical protein